MGKEPSFWRSACDMDDLRERDIILALFRKRALLLQGSPTTGPSFLRPSLFHILSPAIS